MTAPDKLFTSIECQQGLVRAVRYSADGNYCLTSGSDKTIALWNPYKNLKIKTYEGQGFESLDVRASQDNSKFACCGMDKNVRCIDVATGKVLRKFRGHAGRVNCVTFNDDSSVLLSGSIDSSVRIWDIKSYNKSEIQILKEARDSVTAIKVSRYEIFTASADGCLRRYDIRNGRVETDSLSVQGISSIDHTNKTDVKGENFKCVLVSVLEGKHFLIDTTDGKLLAEYFTHGKEDSKAVPKGSQFQIDNCLSFDDELAFSGSQEGYVYCWDLLESTLKAKLDHGATDNFKANKVVASLSAHPTKNHLLTASSNSIYLWTTE
ncbi:unnamed protein product [Gordionus sp. m RMFG-2023]|uniref:WD repeat domain-containing protein 83-like n=1 Tax=Gordionus sp. m RMFG-2023 TaxID=3053472 RepID=UPI0030E17D4B